MELKWDSKEFTASEKVNSDEEPTDIFIVKNFDEEVLKIKVTTTDIGYKEYNISKIYREDLIPTEMGVFGLEQWLLNRTIPKNKAFIKQLIETLGTIKDPIEIIKITMGLSVIDTYWIVKEDFKGTWKEYNLYDNEFDSALSLTAFSGRVSNIKGIGTSPEFSTDGMLKKCWRRLDGKLYLFKGGTKGYANAGLEPYSEYYASQIANVMGLEHIEYDLGKFKGDLVSICPAFTNEQEGYVPMGHLLKGNTNKDWINTTIDIYTKDKFADLIMFDTLICNTDRHYGNFGMIRQNKSNLILRPAPIFDNGMSLFHNCLDYDFDEGIENYATTLINAFNINPIKMSKSLMGPEQRKKLKKMINFKFKRHLKYNLPEWRLIAIEEFLQYRIKEMLI